MGKDNQAYFVQRAAEETAAAERADCAAAADVHRELSLRYSLRVILPEHSADPDDAQPIGLPQRAPQGRAPVPSTRPTVKRKRA